MSDELQLRRENNIPELFMEVQDDSFQDIGVIPR